MDGHNVTHTSEQGRAEHSTGELEHARDRSGDAGLRGAIEAAIYELLTTQVTLMPLYHRLANGARRCRVCLAEYVASLEMWRALEAGWLRLRELDEAAASEEMSFDAAEEELSQMQDLIHDARLARTRLNDLETCGAYGSESAHGQGHHLDDPIQLRTK